EILKPDAGSMWKLTREDGVFAEWGVHPKQLLDLLSLYGDSADNIPGVRGIGVKTASKLLTDYQNLDGIYTHIDEIKGAIQKKLTDGKENAYFSQKLIRLYDNVPCDSIDEAIFGEIKPFTFSEAIEKLKSLDVPSVAKQYAQLAVENGETPLKNDTSNDKGNAFYRNSNDGESTQSALQENLTEQRQITKNEGVYRGITEISELHAFIDSALLSPEKTIAYDCETDSLDTMTAQIVGFSLSFEEGSAVYIPLITNNIFENAPLISKKDAFAQLKRIFEDEKMTVVFHNGKFDWKILINNAFCEPNWKPKCTFADTMIAAWLLSPERIGKNAYSLEYLAETKLSLRGIEFSEIVSKKETFADIPFEKAIPYAAEDADFTLKLWNIQKKALKDENLYALFAETEMKIMPILANMEIAGIHLEAEILYQYNEELTQKIEETEKAVYSTVGHPFNIASPKQLQTVLFEERKLKPGKKTKTGYSTDTTVLEDLSMYDEVPKMILEFRELSKLQSTYVETLPKMCDKNGRIHTDFLQTGTATGRLSCHEPNLQNIPVRSDAGRKIRSAFVAPEGSVFISADYSQIELVVLAHLSQDETMCRAFTEGTDIHKATAALIYGVKTDEVTSEMRRTAKTINFGVIYGMSAFRLANSLGISRTQASQFIENYFKLYSKINDFIETTIKKAEETGFVETIFGRKRPIMNINSRNKIEKAAAERIAVNTPVQGSAADIVKRAMIDVNSALEKENNNSRLLLQVHDELILECPDDVKIIEDTKSIIRDKMENAVKLRIPLRVSIECGKNWGKFH
ncbi:MAG: DNA polymerase I, partial [Treponemataceae bacterium]|nr:DNA polymerase I [Treponemataceae bacterium]